MVPGRVRLLAVSTSAVLSLMLAGADLAAQVQPKAPCNCSASSVKNHPYTAEYRITNTQTLANGTTITRVSTEIIARDSQLRQYNSNSDETPQPGRGPGTAVNVSDPVEGTQANWDSRTKKATLTRLPPQDQRHGCWADDSGFRRMQWSDGTQHPVTPPPPQPGGMSASKSESLGTMTIQGVEAHGTRTTRTIPSGEIGNDAPLVTTEESWWVTDLGLLGKLVRDDPRSGNQTRELVNLTLGDPDPSLFQPPDGYEVKTVELHQVACSQ